SGILPAADNSGHEWPRLAWGRLNQHFGTILALQHLRLEEDENERLRSLEYLAIAFFASDAARQAAVTRAKGAVLKNSLGKLAAGISQQVSRFVDGQDEDSAYFWQLVTNLEERFATHLGLARLDKPIPSVG